MTAPTNYLGHNLIITISRGNETVTCSAGIQDHEYIIDKLYGAARDPHSEILAFSAPTEFFDILAEHSQVVFDTVTARLPKEIYV